MFRYGGVYLLAHQPVNFAVSHDRSVAIQSGQQIVDDGGVRFFAVRRFVRRDFRSFSGMSGGFRLIKISQQIIKLRIRFRRFPAGRRLFVTVRIQIGQQTLQFGIRAK
jgi:hypothetical protein